MRYEDDLALKERETHSWRTIRQKQEEGGGNTGGQVQKKKEKRERT